MACYGGLSDYKGRRFVIVLHCFMMALGITSTFLIALFETSQVYLFIGNFMLGQFAQNLAVVGLSNSQRAKRKVVSVFDILVHAWVV